MQAGKLRHRVAIQQNTPTRNEFGEEIEGWATLATVWAAVEPLGGDKRSEFFDPTGNQLLAEATTRIRVRYRGSLTHQMRVIWRDKTFDIQHVANISSRDREIHLYCKEQPDG